MNMISIIQKKKEAHALSSEEIQFFINRLCDGSIPDYQASALLMAICINGMNEEETNALTFAMRDSGTISDLSSIPGIKVDKHSTGGVADTTTLIALPIAAACGVPIAKMSGRGLGHTGGTLDKLSAIPGYRIEQSPSEIQQIVEKCGVALVGQSKDFAPADKKLYALRDVTATVASLPLIASSIMSKKLASGSDALVLDVKTGSGAFLKSQEEAKELAKILVKIGKAANLETRAVISDMNQPLGQAIGNSLEIMEACDILKTGKVTALTKVSLTIAAQMILLAKIEKTYTDAMLLAMQNLNNGFAFRKLKEMVSAHGGDITYLETPSKLALSAHKQDLLSLDEGYLIHVETEEIGRIAMTLGAGRLKIDDDIDLGAGIWFNPRIGDYINKGDRIATLWSNDISALEIATQNLYKALKLSTFAPNKLSKSVYDVIS